MDYEERTLYSTWNVSFQQVRDQDPTAAELLKLMAYLDNQDIWYGLFHKDISNAPAWWIEVLKSRARFNRAISILHNYSLLEVNAGQYSLHTCEHDWTLECLNHEFDQERCRIAIQCVAANVSEDSEAEYWVRDRRVLPHARRYKHDRIKAVIDWSRIDPKYLHKIAYLYERNDMKAEALEMNQQVLSGKEKALDPEHVSTLYTVNNLANLYKDQGKLTEAEEMYQQALSGYKKALGPEHLFTLQPINNLGNLYRDEGKMTEAEKMFQQALSGKHISTLNTINNLGILYIEQGRMTEAGKMFQQALSGRKKALGSEHISTLDTVNGLGVLYTKQGKMKEAEEMFQKALSGYKKAWGSEHTSTLDTAKNLGNLYSNHGKIFEA